MVFCFYLIFLFVLLYEPIFGCFGFKKFTVEGERNANARLDYYKSIMVSAWLPTVFIILIVAFTELTLKDIGLSVPKVNFDSFGVIVTSIVFLFMLIQLIAVLYYIIGSKFSIKIRQKLTEEKQKELSKSSYSEILPVSKREKKAWSYVSLTAGITEEIIYRGFLIFALGYLFPNFSIWFIILIASFLFGLAHTYQGFINGVVRTSVFGLLFSILYVGIGSIIPIIALHFLIDYMGKLGDSEK